jgi:glutathione S-transferase
MPRQLPINVQAGAMRQRVTRVERLARLERCQVLKEQREMEGKNRTFILHHYEVSPYAEKIRAMFGLTGHAWGSVLSPPYPPRPVLDELAGGYRRIPVAQLGADIFCDTALIAEEVAAFTEHAELAPRVESADAQALVERAEGAFFFAAITSVPPLQLLGKLILRNGPTGTLRFVRDRTSMMQGASVKPPRGKAATQLLRAFLADLDAHLSERDWVDSADPGYADFCIYHPIWLALSVGSARILQQHANVRRWLGRMQELGQGGRVEMSAEEAFSEAEIFSPRALPPAVVTHALLGEYVSIAPDDYGKVGTRGVLLSADADRYILARSSERFGVLHVHFPRAGYALKRSPAAGSIPA